MRVVVVQVQQFVRQKVQCLRELLHLGFQRCNAGLELGYGLGASVGCGNGVGGGCVGAGVGQGVGVAAGAMADTRHTLA